MKKRLVIIGVILLIGLLFVESMRPEDVQVKETVDYTMLKIGMVVNNATQDHYQEFYYDLVSDYAREKGVHLVLLDAEGDSEKQRKHVQSLISMNCDCIVIWPVNSEEAVEYARLVSEAGIPCMTANTKIEPEGEPYIKCHVGPSCYEESAIVAEEMIRQLGDHIKIAEIQGPERYASSEERSQALEDVVNKTNAEILDSQSSQGSRQVGQQIAEEYLKKYKVGELDAIFTFDDNTAYGVWNALEEAGRQNDVKIYAVAVGKYESLDYVRDGKISGAVVQSPRIDAEAAVDMAISIAAGNAPERFENPIDTPLLTKDTVDNIYLEPW